MKIDARTVIALVITADKDNAVVHENPRDDEVDPTTEPS
jgi:hypothetical protein